MGPTFVQSLTEFSHSLAKFTVLCGYALPT